MPSLPSIIGYPTAPDEEMSRSTKKSFKVPKGLKALLEEMASEVRDYRSV
jgi:hypothetical protein